jgi:hypothetical protein
LNPPLPFARKRFAAPRLVFSFGMTFLSLVPARSSVAFGWAGGPAPVAAKALDTRTLDSFDRL